MPVYEIQKDGKTFEVEAPSIEAAQTALGLSGAAPRPQPSATQPPAGDSTERGFWGDVGAFAGEALQSVNPVTINRGIQQAFWHPIDTGKAVLSAQDAVRQDAVKRFNEGDYAGAAAKALYWMLPLVGPRLSQAGDYLEQGDIARGLGATTDVGLGTMGPQAALQTARAVRLSPRLRPRNQALSEAADYAQRQGVPLDAATATGRPIVAKVQKRVSDSMGGAGRADAFKLRQADELARVGRELTEKVRPGRAVTPEQAGQGVRNAVSARVQQFSKQADQAYDQVRAAERAQGGPQPLQFSDEVTGASGRQADGVIAAKLPDGRVVGRLEYSALDDAVPKIKHVEVAPEFRRQGIGTRLVDELSDKYPDTAIEWGGTTPDGTALRASYRRGRALSLADMDDLPPAALEDPSFMRAAVQAVEDQYAGTGLELWNRWREQVRTAAEVSGIGTGDRGLLERIARLGGLRTKKGDAFYGEMQRLGQMRDQAFRAGKGAPKKKAVATDSLAGVRGVIKAEGRGGVDLDTVIDTLGPEYGIRNGTELLDALEDAANNIRLRAEGRLPSGVRPDMGPGWWMRRRPSAERALPESNPARVSSFAVNVKDAKRALRPLYDELSRESRFVQLQGARGRGLVALDRLMRAPDAAPLTVVEGALGDLKAMLRSTTDAAGRRVLSETIGKVQAAVDDVAARVSRPAAALAKVDDAYRMQHKAPTIEGAPGHAVNRDVFPDDIYSADAARLYGHGTPTDGQAIKVIQRIKGNPDADVMVYRAVPKSVTSINDGDWVTTVRKYADDHMVGEDGWHVLSKKVKAKDIRTDGNSIYEFGYSPERAAGVGQIDDITARAGQFETGRAVTFKAIRNPEKAPQMGERFQQHLEPSGRYLQEASGDVVPPGWESAQVTFKNPLVVKFNKTAGNTYDAGSWKAELSRRFGGKTGDALAREIREQGYDGIVTVDTFRGKPVTSEIVDLSGVRPSSSPVDVSGALRAGRKATVDKYHAESVLKTISEEPVRAFSQATWARDAGIGRLRQIAKLAPDEMPKVGRAFLEDMMTKATSRGGFDHADALWTTWRNMGPETKKLLFKNPLHRQELDKFFLVAKKIAENPNPSGTASVLTATNLAFLIPANVMARMMYSPKGVDLLTRGLRIPIGNRSAATAWTAEALRYMGESKMMAPAAGLVESGRPEVQPEERVIQ